MSNLKREYDILVREMLVRIKSLTTQQEDLKGEFFKKYEGFYKRIEHLTALYNDLKSMAGRTKEPTKIIQLKAIRKNDICPCLGKVCKICKQVFENCDGCTLVEGEYIHKECIEK